jgi:hypothetical protein
MTHNYNVVITRQYSWAYATVKGYTPEDALPKVRRKIARDHHNEAFDYKHFDDIGDIETISVNRGGGTLAHYIPPDIRVALHAKSLLAALESVMHWWTNTAHTDDDEMPAHIFDAANAVIAKAKGRVPHD